MGRPEIMRSGDISLGDNAAPGEIDEKEHQRTDTIGPVPEENQPGHAREDDPDKPVEKFAKRFPADGGDTPEKDGDERREEAD
jgi:hypothetical protein